FLASSCCVRWAAVVRRPWRTSRISSQPGTLRSSRSTSAVPTNPVAPVMAIRFPASASAITALCSSMSLYQMVERSTRQRTLDAALDLFGARGVDAVSLDEIARAVGVRKQTVLYWFPSKDDLVDAVLETVAAELAVVIDAAVRSAPDDP